MKEQLLDDIKINQGGILINKHYGQARLVIFFYTIMLLFYVITGIDYGNIDLTVFLTLLGKILFVGYIFYTNFKQLKNEKTGEKAISMLGKWEGIIFLILLVLMLIHSIIHFIGILTTNWYSFPTLVYFCIILSVSAICVLEFRYLKDLFSR